MFLLHNGQVTGPYEREKLDASVAARSIPTDAMYGPTAQGPWMLVYAPPQAQQVPQVARRESKNEFIGKGALVQGIGLLMPGVGWFFAGGEGALVGVVLFFILLVIGSRLSLVWSCGACKNPLPSGDVKICGACRSQLV
jgi:hypothetical protein